MAYQVELVWNREFDFVTHGKPHANLDDAIRFAEDMESSGDGARVKKTRVVDETGEVVWAYGKKIKKKKEEE